MRIHDIITEAKTPLTLFKSYIADFVKSKNIKITSSSRGGTHIRFPLEGDLNTFAAFFKELNITVTESPVTISGTFDTYILTQEEDIDDNIPAGISIPWVNNIVGKGTKTDKQFNTKELSPDYLGIAGMELTQSQIVKTVKNALTERYNEEIVNELMYLIKLSASTDDQVHIGKQLSFNKKDLATISKDFGEVLAAIWATGTFKFNKIFFPAVSNEQLIDFYGVRMGIKYPISVKSGGGGKVTIQNIIEAIRNRPKTAKKDHSQEKSLQIFEIVNNNPAKTQMILLHQALDTDAIKVLGQIMAVDYKDITLGMLKEWTDQYSNSKLKKLLAPFHKVLDTKLTDEIWNRDDKLRFIISPLGESIHKILNSDDDIQKSLTKIAQQVVLIQINIDVKSSMIVFRKSKFKDADFEFGWAGYAAGNKLGFKMKLNK